MNAVPSGPLLLDCGIYIRSSRGEDYEWATEDAQIFRRTILSAVVAAELYAGTHDAREKRALDAFCSAYRALDHFSTPPEAAWIDCGMLLRRAHDAMGKMDFVHHFRDLHIAVEAARVEATLVSENVRDFERWRGLLASARRKLRLFHIS